MFYFFGIKQKYLQNFSPPLYFHLGFIVYFLSILLFDWYSLFYLFEELILTKAVWLKSQSRESN
jgi:hypothetical protein